LSNEETEDRSQESGVSPRTPGRGTSVSCLLTSVFCLLALFAPSVCADDYDPVFDLWPILRYDAVPEKSLRHLEALGPIVEWRDAPLKGEFYARPFGNRRDDRESGVVESEWPWPLGFGTGRPDLDRSVLFPIFLRDHDTFSDGSEQDRFVLLPLLFYKRRHETTDFMFFPFYGSFHNMFGRERALFVLWPCYVYQRARDGESWSWLHPIFAYRRNAGGGRGFKMWPVFGFNRVPEKERRWFALWPVFNYRRVKRDKGESKAWTVFPLYGSIRDPSGSERVALWPFFKHRVDRNLGRDDWWLPWPVFGLHRGEKRKGWTFWPLYSTRRKPTKREVDFLWPLGWYRRTDEEREKATSFRIVPLMFREREERLRAEDKKEKKLVKTGAWQVWPLVKCRSLPGDRTELEVPSILPIRYYAPWERNFAPFFRVFRYYRTSEGVKSWRLLWRFVRVDRGPKERFFEITPLFKIHTMQTAPEGPKDLRWRFLKGLVGYERTRGKRSWRFLYFIRTGAGRDAERQRR